MADPTGPHAHKMAAGFRIGAAALAAAPILGSCLGALLTGALVGLASAALGAALYALHCTDDSPLFVATWYGAAALLMTGIGAILGARLLRW